VKYENFRALHERPGVFVIPNPWNGGSAKILTALGFEALATTSAGYAFSVGLPDEPAVLKRDGVLANAKEIVNATHLPVSADLQNGFGPTPRACAETIRMAHAIGLAGGSIEDASNDPKYPIYEFELSVERIAAAAAEAKLLGFVLTARA
jgi:2-methylisocitrate lyase-like PEP mutase family enzyme